MAAEPVDNKNNANKTAGKTDMSVEETQQSQSPPRTPGTPNTGTPESDPMDCRQNYAVEVENAVNEQINRELDASYRYLAMANYFARPTVALAGAAAFFAGQSVEERCHAQKLIDYQNSRGGKVTLMSLEAPARQQWPNLLEAVIDALEIEKQNNAALLRLHEIASEKTDPDFTNFLEEFYLKEQVYEIEKMTRFAGQLRRVGAGLGEHIWDQELLREQHKTAGRDHDN